MADNPLCPVCRHPRRQHDKLGCEAAGGECICHLTEVHFSAPAPAPSSPEKRAAATGGGPCPTCGKAFYTHVCLSCSPDSQTPGPGCHNCRDTGMDQTPCVRPDVATAPAAEAEPYSGAGLPPLEVVERPAPAAEPTPAARWVADDAADPDDDYDVDQWATGQLERVRAAIAIVDRDPVEPIAALLAEAEQSGNPRLVRQAEKVRDAVTVLEDLVAQEVKRAEVEQEIAQLREQLAAAEARLRELSGASTPKPAARTGGPSAREVRAWARENDIECPAVGTVPARVMEAYRAAHSGVSGE